MQRRFLPALLDHRYRTGAFATEWEGWVNPRDRSIDFAGRVNIAHPGLTQKVERRVGCYAILYETASGSRYTAYIGFSRDLRRELETRIKDWDIERASFPFTAVYVSNAAVASAYEEDLIRYYCPPWNMRFYK